MSSLADVVASLADVVASLNDAVTSIADVVVSYKCGGKLKRYYGLLE